MKNLNEYLIYENKDNILKEFKFYQFLIDGQYKFLCLAKSLEEAKEFVKKANYHHVYWSSEPKEIPLENGFICQPRY